MSTLNGGILEQSLMVILPVVAGLKITSDTLIGKSTWDALFQPPNFFSKYKYLISPCFVCLNVKALSQFCSAGLFMYHLNVFHVIITIIVAIKSPYFVGVVFV